MRSQNPNAGEVLLSAALGWEFADLGGRHHLGGGSHGSLDDRRLGSAGAHDRPRGETEARSITELAPLALRALGVAPLVRAA